MVESVYCAVGTDSLCKAEYVWSLQVSKCKSRAGIVKCMLLFYYRKACGYFRAVKLVSAQYQLALNLICFYFHV